MQAVRAHARGKSRIARDQQHEPARPREAHQRGGKVRARRGIAVAQDDGGALREHTRRCEKIGQSRFVGHQDQGRQSTRPTRRIESARRPC
jgi:hypothetical protein